MGRLMSCNGGNFPLLLLSSLANVHHPSFHEKKMVAIEAHTTEMLYKAKEAPFYLPPFFKSS